MDKDDEEEMRIPPKTHRYVVTARDIKRFAQSIGDTNPLYYDETYAKQTSYGSIIAPPLFCQCMTFEDVPVNELSEDLSPVELKIDLPATKTMGGESHYILHKNIRPGDIITVSTQVESIMKKQGKSGQLFLVSIKTRFVNQLGELVAEELATYVKR